MFFALTDEQRAMHGAVRDLLAERFDTAAVRRACGEPGGPAPGDADPAELRKWLAELGVFAVLVPQRYGGLGLGLLDAAVVARALGAGVAPGTWLPTAVATEAIRRAGSPGQQEAWLPRVAAGDVRLALGGRAAGGGWDAAGVGVVASGGRLTGTAALVEGVHVADALVVAGREGADIGLYLVELPAPGVQVLRLDTMDRTARLSDVVLAGAAGERLAGGTEVYLDVLDRAAVLVANDLVGTAREALARTVRHGGERVQFGRPVGSFQAIKHALADIHVGVTMAEHAALYAAHAVDEGLADAALATSVAKAKAGQAASAAVAAMVQFHGGIGYTWEHDAHLFFKRAKRQEYAYGDPAWHLERVAGLVVDRPPAG